MKRPRPGLRLIRIRCSRKLSRFRLKQRLKNPRRKLKSRDSKGRDLKN